MGTEQHQHEAPSTDACRPQAAHPDPTEPKALIPAARAAFDGQVPPWPASMIEPSESELARWSELWGHPQAAMWVETGQEHVVAALVRVEQRCRQNVPSKLARSELDRLRGQLGLKHS
jgi:hypothetical protein